MLTLFKIWIAPGTPGGALVLIWSGGDEVGDSAKSSARRDPGPVTVVAWYNNTGISPTGSYQEQPDSYP